MTTITESTNSSAKQVKIFQKIADKIKYVSIYLHKKDNQPQRTKFTLDMTRHEVRTNKDGAMFNPSKFNGTRCNENFMWANAMCLDFDKRKPSMKEIRATFPYTLMWIYTTHSHTPDKPRYRVVIPLSRQIDKNEHLAAGRAFNETLTPKLKECLDISCFERARPHYLPACPQDQADNAKSRFYDGEPLDADELIAIGKEIPSEKAIKRGTTKSEDGAKPGDDYMRRHSIIDVMHEFGWTHVNGDYWAKPGDTSGDHHAKLFGDGVFVYSTSAPVPKGYHDAFSFLAHSLYNGDFSAAATELRIKGYGNDTASNSGRLFIDPSTLLNMQRESDSLVGNLIKQGTTGQIFGPPEAGKSFVALDIALSIATGMEWNEYKCQQGLVIYCVGEGWSGFRNRIHAWQVANGYPDISLFRTSRNVIIFDDTELKAVSEELRLYERETGHKVAMIVIDTLARHLDGDENSSNEISKFINKVDGLRGVFPGSSAIIVHHSGHGKDARARGSSALRAAMDFEINCNNNALTFTKMKDGAKPDPTNFILDVVELYTDTTGEPVTSCVVSYGKKPERSSQKAPAGSAELSDIDRIAVEALMLASVKCKEKVDNNYGADIKTWRSTFYDLRRKHDEDIAQDTLKKSFSRAKESLFELRHIAVVEDTVLLTDTAKQADIKGRIKSAK